MRRPRCMRTLGAFAWALVVAAALASPAAPVTEEALEALGLVPASRPFEAPDFRLPTIDRGEVSLSEHRGQVVVLNFWTTW